MKAHKLVAMIERWKDPEAEVEMYDPETEANEGVTCSVYNPATKVITLFSDDMGG